MKKWSARAHALIGIGAIVALVGGIGGWSASTRIAGAVIASGQIEVESNRQIVQHPDGGVVGQILVDDGDRVEAGEVLLRLDDKLLRSELTIIEGQYYEVLARQARLEAERDGADELLFAPELVDLYNKRQDIQQLVNGQIQLFEARRETTSRSVSQLRERQTQIGLQIEGSEAQLTALSRQSELIAEELENQQSLLRRGLAQASRVLSLQREEARLLGERGALQSGIAESRGRIAEIEIEILSLTTQQREEAISTLRDLSVSAAELRERRLSTLEILARMDVTAPASGLIYGKSVFAPRTVVQAAEPLMYIVPQDSPLVIKARVDPINIDQLHLGQHSVLRFAAFDAKSTPELQGHVTHVSADILFDENSGTSFYEIKLLPNEGELAKLNGLELIPGMPVEAFVQTRERTALNFLTKPFTDYFTHAFRED